MSEIGDKLTALKEKGNNHFRKKAFKEAIKQYSEAIKLFEDVGAPTTNENVKTLASQIYTNRAACFMSLKQISSVITDTTFVLKNLDSNNQKALWRRGFAYKAAELYEEANRDFVEYQKRYGNDKEVTKSLNESMKLMVEKKKKLEAEKKKREEELKNRPKI